MRSHDKVTGPDLRDNAEECPEDRGACRTDNSEIESFFFGPCRVYASLITDSAARRPSGCPLPSSERTFHADSDMKFSHDGHVHSLY